ncbi:MAG TPA: hypothetical protein VFQ12_00355 [Thermoleophilaceae bacterium]|nr:hypothetical protein [Thermoleophilaceae bacterium]
MTRMRFTGLTAMSSMLVLALGGAVPALAQGATGDEPAGGAAAGEAIGATVAALVVTALIALVIAGHRSGRLPWLDRAAGVFERQTGLPGWAALPAAVLGVSLLTAVTGMYWDISLHIDNGRDAGPLANPAHYLILIGLYGALLAGALTMALSRGRPSDSAVHIGQGWWAPAGGLMIAACGAFALTGFPLDDLWHRLFGQDVTLWGPTHLMLIGGGSLATLGAMALTTEAMSARGGGEPRESPLAMRIRRAFLVGGFLVALSTFQGEFDFGVPQFRLVLHPTLEMLAAGIGLVTARIYLGRGGALSAVAGFLVIRGFLALTVGVIFGQTTPHFPLYIVEALLVELVFLRATRLRPVAAGALAGVAIGTIGLAAEWGWSYVWMPIPWPSSLLPEAALAGFTAAVAGGAVGGFVGAALVRPRPFPPLRAERLAALAAGVALAAVVALGVPVSTDGPRQASVQLRDLAGSDGGRHVAATIRVSPAHAADDPAFLNVTAWQGGGSMLDPLERVGPGVYRTTEPIPVHDGWKAMVRLQRGDGLVAVPIYLPRDRAIPAPEVPATASFTREFRSDRELLQRERKEGVSGSLTAGAYLTVLAIALSLIALIAWVLLRLESGAVRGPRREGPDRPGPARSASRRGRTGRPASASPS